MASQMGTLLCVGNIKKGLIHGGKDQANVSRAGGDPTNKTHFYKLDHTTGCTYWQATCFITVLEFFLAVLPLSQCIEQLTFEVSYSR